MLAQFVTGCDIFITCFITKIVTPHVFQSTARNAPAVVHYLTSRWIYISSKRRNSLDKKVPSIDSESPITLINASSKNQMKGQIGSIEFDRIPVDLKPSPS